MERLHGKKKEFNKKIMTYRGRRTNWNMETGRWKSPRKIILFETTNRKQNSGSMESCTNMFNIQKRGYNILSKQRNMLDVAFKISSKLVRNKLRTCANK